MIEDSFKLESIKAHFAVMEVLRPIIRKNLVPLKPTC